MVFEAVVVELLNKFLKQYVENLDTSQLKIGIWGGDVILNDLMIKTSAFDDLNLPVRVKWGKLGKFAMKIPWKNLYASQVVVDIEELLVLLVPCNEFKYDPVKEEKWENDKKQARLKAVEEARKRESEMDMVKQSDGFIEKLLTQIIRNIQVVIRNIHIRYEDKTTNPNFPFSVGVTMSNLSATTIRDQSGEFENSNFICKVVHLEGLAIYWNPHSNLFSELSSHDLINALLDSIPKDNFKPNGYLYLFGPLSASASLKLNPKPENDESNFTIPKVFVNVHLKEIELAVTHNQFHDALLFAQSYHQLSAAAKYKKYRPVGIPVTGHAVEWWHFAYNCVVENIRRRKREWSWGNIREHRQMCRKYSELYEAKLNSKKVSSVVADELDILEKKLNVFNILLLREQAYVQVERSNVEKESRSSQGGWFSGWFGYGAASKPSQNENDIVKKIESVMTPQEKEKLYKAIGYDESAPVPNYPPEFVELKFLFHLDEIKVTVLDDESVPLLPIVLLSVKTVRIGFEQRPAALAMKFSMDVGKFFVLGKKGPNDQNYPELVTSNCAESESLIEILYETKPLIGSCDQRVHINARPLRIIYHAETINKVRDVFTTGPNEDVSKIVSVTSASLPAFQKMTAMGLQYAIEKRTIIEVKVNMMPSYLIIPYGGSYNKNKEMLVVMFGRLTIQTEENEQKDISVKKLYLEGTSEQEIFSTVLSASYTNFKCELTGVQVLLQLVGEDWVQASKIQGKSPLRFLESTDLVVTIKKSLVTDDPRIPKMICEGKLPSLAFNFSEERFIAFAALLCSIPIKTDEPDPFLKKGTSMSAWSLQSIGTQLESKLVPISKEHSDSQPADCVQGIDLVIHFEMNELSISVSKSKDGSLKDKGLKHSSAEDQFLSLKIVKLEVELTLKTFETVNLLKLGGLEFHQYHKKSILPFVTTKGLGHDYYLFIVEYINVSVNAPNFRTEKGAIVNRLSLNVTPLNVVLNKEALLAQLAFFTRVQTRLENVKQNCRNFRMGNSGKSREIIWEAPGDVGTERKLMPKGKKFRKKLPKKEIIDFFLDAALEEINVMVEFEGQGLMEFSIKGGSVEISSRKSYTNFDFKLCEIVLSDLNPQTIHKKIIESMENKTLYARVTVFNSEYFGTDESMDMSVEAEVGGLRCSFLNLFFSRVLAFSSAFHVQIQSLKESATVAAHRAKQNVIKAYKNTSRICLNIKINAPLLIIPRKCSSLEVLVVDLGVLTVKNHIIELSHAVEGGSREKPVIDNMRFNLQNLKFSRCLLGNDMNTFECEKTFLVPVTFELSIKRNLSPDWLKIIPEFEIVARLAAVHVTLTHDDLSSIANIIRSNTGEGADSIAKKSSKERADSKLVSKAKETEQQQPAEVVDDDSDDKQSSSFYTVVKFMFYMDSFVFDALAGDDEMVNNTVVGEDTGLARFVLETISIKGRQFSNGSIDTSMLLVSCLLNDTRPGKEGRLTKLMERTDASAEEKYPDSSGIKSMIEVTYKKKDLDAFVDVRVYKFTLILSMDFLHKLKEFFTIEDTSRPGDAEPLDTAKAIRSIENRTKHLIEESSERPPTFTVNLRLEKPDIIIVENMDSIDTDALIFHTEILMKYRFAGVRQVISGTLSDIELYSCCFNPQKRRNTLSQVIKPFTISVAGSTPQDQGLHVDICLSEISVNVNPSTVELISKCYEALLSKSSVNKQYLQETDFSDIWNPRPFNADDFWFLETEQGEDALTAISSSSIENIGQKKGLDEICLLSIPSIVVLVEGLTGKQAKPLLLLEMGFQLQCYNWSTKLNISSSLTLQLQYYNKVFTAWEPLVEPVEIQEDKEKKIKHSYKPWDLNLSVVCGDEGYLDAVEPPKVSISISCTEVLPINITKTGLEVLKNVVDTYTSAVSRNVEKKIIDLPPLVIRNETGLVAELLLTQSNLQVWRAISDNYKVVKLESDSEVELQTVLTKFSVMKIMSTTDEKKKETQLHVQFPISKSNVLELPLNLASKRYFPIPLRQFDVEEVWGLVSDVSVKDNTTTLTLRSIVKVVNYFTEAINIHSLLESGNEAEFIGVVEGNSTFSLPFHAVYNSSKKLFFSVKGHFLSGQPFSWEAIKKDAEVALLLQCNSKTPENNDPFFIQAVGELEEIYFGNTNRRTNASICYTIHLQPTVKIVNSLPVDLVICFQGCARERHLQPGNNLQITNAEPGTSSLTLRITNYLEKEWSSKETIVENPPEFFIWKLISYNGLSSETLNLGVHCTFTRKTAVYTVYCPYFMVNKTDHLLSYRFEGSQTVFYHPKDFVSPVMFSPSYRKFFSKKSAYLRMNHSDWSEKFPVDVAGSGGTIECEDANQHVTYKVSVTITLTFNSLTKIVTFTPYYVFVNETSYILQCRECEYPDDWLEIRPGSGTPFWPRSSAKANTIEIKPKASDAVTPPFHYSSTDTCLLRLNHKYGGIFVNIQATQSGTYITFSPYEPGQAPALIINYSAKPIKLFEIETNFEIVLKPNRKVMHAWSSPTGKRKLTLLNPKHTKDEIPLDQDTKGQVYTSKGESVRYVTFLDGTQRILLFTDDIELSSSITNFQKASDSGIELICEIKGVGISIVNNTNCTDILYMSLISSGIAWEMKKPGKSRYKRMKQEDISKIEEAYVKYQNESSLKEDVAPEINVTDKMKVNFETMRMLQPQVRELKRTYEPGVWLAYRIMEEQVMINLRVNKIQIDNQLIDCIFPVVLSPVPPPKSVAALYEGSKPFFELSIVKKAADKSGVEQYKYFEILVQEFQIKIDIGFIQQLWLFLAPEKLSDEEEKINFLKDLQATEKPLICYVQVVSSSEHKDFYEFLHLSPLKIHFSFSLAGNIESGSLPPALSVMIQSVGVTLTDVHDVIFRLSYFERKCVFLTKTQLQSEVISHYYGQTLRQAYVLLFGLDVIGNPFGLIVGIGEGVEAFFYEPFQGIVHGPSEFATGVAIGCKNLFGRTVGSTAGTLGKLTETLGKGLAVLSLDKEYQLQRMEHQNRQENIQASMARGGRGLVMGVFEGVTGVVRKPLEGAKEEGVGGFLKGMGKGMMGLVTRPVTGVVDFASTSFNAVRRATGPHFENKRLRPPRFFRDDQLLRPYNLYEALGNSIFHAICRRKYCASDKYEHHIPLRDKEVAVFTNKRMILAELNEFFGTWQEHMAITWNSMPERPHCHSKGVAITLPEKNRASIKGKPEVKVLLISDLETRQEVCKRMVELYKLEKEDCG